MTWTPPAGAEWFGRLRRVVPVLLALVVLASCTSLPSSGPVNSAGEISSDEAPPLVDIGVQRPQPGANEREIALGFVLGMRTYAPGYATAREFLEPAAAENWNPEAGITVFEDTQPTVEREGEGSVRMTFNTIGEVDASGNYTPVDSETPSTVSLSLVAVNDEWRIVDPPPGLLMSEGDFRREYEMHNRYFFAGDGQSLVPDPVYLPRSGSVSTLLVESLLAGPSDDLQPAVQTSFPQGTALDSGVSLSERTAVLDLTAGVEQAPNERRERMFAQLVWTLSTVSEVEEVRATVGGQPMLTDIAGGSDIAPFRGLDPLATLSTDPLVARGANGLVDVEADMSPVPGPLGEQSGITDVALSHDGQRAAAVVGGNRIVAADLAGGGEAAQLHTGDELTSPSWDRTGRLWFVEGGSTLTTVTPGQSPVTVPVGGPGTGAPEIGRIAVSPDGARIAMVVDGTVMVGAIGVNADGAVTRVDSLVPLGPEASDGLDVAWYGASDVVALVAEGDGSTRPYQLSIAGLEQVPRQPVDGGERITAAADQRLVVGDADGRLFGLGSVGSWESLARAYHPAFPG
ncbi:MAG TPA: LpqB family beta-propeller domain-containing protein [Jiangellaceae bacterium]|nr:LpqB family beta-propeller domain-containing protein [Jiangellaceae bacterium]